MTIAASGNRSSSFIAKMGMGIYVLLRTISTVNTLGQLTRVNQLAVFAD
jgi:hypothetical protein